jgi:hypothetical protein
MRNAIMLNAAMLNAIMLSVVAPQDCLVYEQQFSRNGLKKGFMHNQQKSLP